MKKFVAKLLLYIIITTPLSKYLEISAMDSLVASIIFYNICYWVISLMLDGCWKSE
jgi:hypothetical protein